MHSVLSLRMRGVVEVQVVTFKPVTLSQVPSFITVV